MVKYIMVDQKVLVAGNVITMDEHAIMTAIEHQQRDAEHRIFFDSPSSLFISFVRKNQDNGFAIVGLPSSTLFGFTITAYGHKKGSADESPMETFLFMTIRYGHTILIYFLSFLKTYLVFLECLLIYWRTWQTR